MRNGGMAIADEMLENIARPFVQPVMTRESVPAVAS
jgi:hypothetical protein